MNHFIPTLNQSKKTAEILQENGELDPTWMMWFPCKEDNLGSCFTNWIDNHPSQIEVINSDHLDPINEWRRQLEEYVPPFPINGLVLTFQHDQTQIIPLKNMLMKGGLSNELNGWNALWKDLVFEPITRIIELMPTHVRLFEVRHTDPELIIELPVNHQPRYKVLRDFLASLIRQYRKEPGPVVVRGLGSGIMELDCWILSGYFNIEAIWKLDGETSCGHWWRQMRHSGRVTEWIDSWSKEFSEKAKKESKYILDEKEIKCLIEKDRLDTLLLSESYSTRLRKIIQLKEILLKQLNVLFVQHEHIGAILR